MKDPLVKGHPLHAMLSDLPIGITVVGVIFDGLSVISEARRWRSAARAALGMALLSGCVAALVGLWDYQSVPHEHPARRTGAVHGWLNASALGLLLFSLIDRWRCRSKEKEQERKYTVDTAQKLSLAALIVLGLSGWFGGELVFRLGWRVVPAEHAEQLEEDLLKNGEGVRIKKAHRIVQEYEQTHALLP
ncbi:MAG TPA: DUF2231 domain-containing protein [Ktedonobacteraceae bacterium]|jgi:uncharacterized membrane protein